MTFKFYVTRLYFLIWDLYFSFLVSGNRSHSYQLWSARRMAEQGGQDQVSFTKKNYILFFFPAMRHTLWSFAISIKIGLSLVSVVEHCYLGIWHDWTKRTHAIYGLSYRVHSGTILLEPYVVNIYFVIL